MSKVRIYKAFHTYEKYLEDFYEKNQSLKYKTFEEQKKALVYDAFPWIFSWTAHNIDNEISIFETVHNCEYLQKAWSKKEYLSNWQINIVLEQIKYFQPHICVLYPPQLFDNTVLEEIRTLVNHDVKIGGYDGMDRQNLNLYDGYDFIITCSEYISQFYRTRGMPTYTLSFGFDDSVLSKIKINLNKRYNVGFSGSIYENVHDGRFELLKKLSKSSIINIKSEFEHNYELFSKRHLKRLIHEKDFKNYVDLWRVGKNISQPVYGLEMFQFLQDSKISLNMHGDKITFAANVRMYEITGVGSCLLTDWKENIEELFIDGKEVITYKSIEEAKDKIKYYLKHEHIRERIALEGQKRTLNQYTYKSTIPSLFKRLKTFL
jgi:spore maturation protein CgeB